MPRLQTQYLEEVSPAIKEEFKIGNPMQLPKVTKISLNMGLGDHINDSKLVNQCVEELCAITGQHAVKTTARKSESGFKIRAGMVIGAKVTLRSQRMWEFLDRFINVVAPRISDFRGLSRKGFDQKGNYSFGVNEQSIFPEINLDKLLVTQGMNINIVFENSNREMSERALELLRFPFERKKV